MSEADAGVNSVPMIVDASRAIGGSSFLRCTYFSIECDRPENGWTLGLQGQNIPFLMMGISGIICHPSRQKRLFDTPRDIIDLFNRVEAAGLAVTTGCLLVPERLAQRTQQSQISKGDAIRADARLFAFLFAAHTSGHDLRDLARRLSDLPREALHSSEVEAAAFRQWARLVVVGAIEQYPKNGEFALRWREEDGDSGPPRNDGGPSGGGFGEASGDLRNHEKMEGMA